MQTAKQVATLDVVSGGRVTLVAGSGWMRREFQVLGVAFEERGDITDEYLRAMRELWTNPTPSFHGARVAFDGIAFAPRCVQSPHVPLWIGGSGPRPMRRLIELGDGWAPMTGTLAEVAGQVARLREALAAAGRDPTRLDVVHGLRAGPADAAAVTASAHASRRSAADADAEAGEAGVSTEELVDRVGRSAAAGVTDVAVSFAWASPAEHAERLEWFATEVMSRCDRGTG